MKTVDKTDALAGAVAEWVSAVLPDLDPEAREIFSAMLEGRLDVAVEVRLRRGTITLRAIDEPQGRFTVLHRQEVAPLRDWNH